jgi:hypothetical protein
VRGILLESTECGGLLAFPTGAAVDGRIISVHRVGMGFRHEVASLEIEFNQIEQNGQPVGIHARVLEVDNAREKVKDGVIKGIRATNAPQDRLSSVVPYLAMWHPGTYWILPAYHAAFPVFPEPEIYFPSGTDLLLGLVSPVVLAPGEHLVSKNQEIELSKTQALDQEVLSLPSRTSTPAGQDADVVNLAFIGSREQLENAFQTAGWLSTDALSKRATMRQLSAILLLHNYPRGPMSEQLFQNQPYDFSWQKNLNSLAKRDHLRIWSNSATWRGQPVWFSSSTKDVGLHLSLRRKKIIHRVDPDIDAEREKIVRDLTFAGCVESVHDAPRPATPHSMENSTGDILHTDGAIAVVQLKDCSAPVFSDTDENAPSSAALPARPATKLARYFRMQVLSMRDLWRENAAYEGVDLSRKAIRSIRRHEENARQVNAISPPPAPKQAASAARQFNVVSK